MKQDARHQVGLGATIESSRSGVIDEWCCGFPHTCVAILYRGHHSAGAIGKSKNVSCMFLLVVGDLLLDPFGASLCPGSAGY